MIREYIQKKSTQVLLLILVAGVWLYNSWQIFSMNTGNEVIQQQEVLYAGGGEDLTLPSISSFEYRGNFRDPFIPVLEVPGTAVNEKPKPKEPEEVPVTELELTGVFGNMAVIQDMYGEIHFVERGDSIGELVLTSISSDSVIFFIENKSISIKLY